MGDALENPKRPFMAILGGKKVSDKIGVIEALLEKVDTLLIGGAMAYTFFKSMGYGVGDSICELDKLDLAQDIMKKAKEKGVKLMLPVDTKVGKEFKPDTESSKFGEDGDIKVVGEDVPDGYMGLDIGPKTVELFAKELEGAKTVIWNGPMGVFEMPKFAEGTKAVCSMLANLEGANTIIGGGDSAAAVKQLGFADKVSHISTGGGASLEYMEGKVLPGIAAINDK